MKRHENAAPRHHVPGAHPGRTGSGYLGAAPAAAIRGCVVDRDNHHGGLVRDGAAVATGVPRPRQAKSTVIVRYTRKTADGLYDAGRGWKLGVTDIFCREPTGRQLPAWKHP
ncbi:hypothetical protein [Streptomyces sp. NPDC002580]|uniref:hypothetical protein n=1 Tax=Streptomyces sp. NPDC002580 TaxID=3364653 RepID=UPI0036BD236B